ncbi:hypothetical protein GCM10009785_16700 [Brooklawnia cerclae]|uniref:Uncharacterized protein n=1 Tax=Brooklawnia cerclae TaxID=349934 RepID=A0ABX0SIF6_9ACTN|nr:hypothetical protein [Brooklawnia cerclae]NIH57760.1 hypothetical protein [Brooklawnia cerclae]
MSLPQMNPLAAKLMGGTDFRRRLRDQILARAAETDDPAFAQRLREAADGKRPLRTLLHDPAFLASMKMDGPDAERRLDEAIAEAGPPAGTPEEVREQWREKLAEIGIPVPDAEEARALLPDVLELQQRAREVLAADRANNWGHDR